jgi:L-ascorbate metabolism protein UlaG (beta-lactamase superfamily)
MEITWYGHSCFRLRDRDATVVTDPYDKSLGYDLPRVRADIVTVSRDHPHHNHAKGVKGDYKVVNRPGEYEIKAVFITGIATYDPKRQNRTQDSDAGDETRNIIFVFEFDGLAICHLGSVQQVPTQAQVEALSNVDVLLAPVGGGSSLNAAHAAEIISLIEPYIVIPMHFAESGASKSSTTPKLNKVDKFLKEMGAPRTEATDQLRITKSNLPNETQVVLLNRK